MVSVPYVYMFFVRPRYESSQDYLYVQSVVNIFFGNHRVNEVKLAQIQSTKITRLHSCQNYELFDIFEVTNFTPSSVHSWFSSMRFLYFRMPQQTARTLSFQLIICAMVVTPRLYWNQYGSTVPVPRRITIGIKSSTVKRKTKQL